MLNPDNERYLRRKYSLTDSDNLRKKVKRNKI